MVALARVGIMAGFLVLLAGGRGVAQEGCHQRFPEDPITLNLRDGDVATVLRLLANQYRVSLIVTDEVQGRATFDFFQTPAREVFRSIVESSNLRCVDAPGVLRVSTAARFKTEEDERFKSEEARTRLEADTRKRVVEAQREQAELDAIMARGPIVERTVRLAYADAEEVARTLQGILGLPPEGSIPVTPLPAIYAPPPPTVIGEPAPPPTAQPIIQASPEILAKGLTVKSHKPTNSVFIRYYANDLERLVRLIREQLDVPLPQVQINAQMIITTQNALEQLGVQWGGAVVGTAGPGGPALVGSGFATPIPTQGGTGVSGSTGNNPNFTGSGALPVSPITGQPVGGNLVNLPTDLLPAATGANPAFGLLLGIISRSFNINIAIQALELLGKARRLSEPRIVTTENAKAVIARGFEVPFVSQTGFGGSNVQFKEALLQLTVIPNVIREEGVTKIRMKILFENNEPDFSGTRVVFGNPSLFKRKNEAEVVVREGDRLVMGGITLDSSGTTRRAVPLLGDIPVFGWLFKSREETVDVEELIVIITPTVVAWGNRDAR